MAAKMTDYQPLFFLIYLICVISGKPDQIARPLPLNKMCSCGWGYPMKKINLIKFKMADLWPFLTSICILIGKRCQIARPLLFNKMCGFCITGMTGLPNSFTARSPVTLTAILFVHSQLCKNNTRADYQKTWMPRN